MGKSSLISTIASFFLLAFILSCHNQVNNSNQLESNKKRDQIEENTKRLLNVFLEKEDMEQLDLLLHDSIEFHWPNKTTINKVGLMEACRGLVTKHDNAVEIIDIVIEDNKSFVLFIWSGIVKQDEISTIVSKEFSIHDCYRLTWEDGRITEWYTIWGSRDYLEQLGYSFVPPQ